MTASQAHSNAARAGTVDGLRSPDIASDRRCWSRHGFRLLHLLLRLLVRDNAVLRRSTITPS